MLVTVELPGLILTNEPGQRDRPFLADLRNWHDGTETLRDSDQREHGFGLYRDDDPAESGRYPIVYGRLLSLTPGDEWTAHETVMALKNLPVFDLWVTDPTGRWRAEVALNGRIVFEIHDDGWCDFEIPLEASDPRKYGQQQTLTTGVPTLGEGILDPIDDPLSEGDPGSSGRVAITNGGSAPSEPIIRVRGGVSEGFELRCLESGQVILVTRPVLDGSEITVDCAAGEVWVDGQSILPAQYVPVTEWFQVEPGATCTIQWTPLGTVSGVPQMFVDFAEASW